MNTDHYWIGYPHTKTSGAFKAYYLIQFGFWIQQIYVVNTDMKRKDYWAMLIHHFITCALIGFSYFMHLTRIGNAILCVMDVSDVFLAVSRLEEQLSQLCILRPVARIMHTYLYLI
jgi:acyl-CoA-dependent ceramide synthase